VRGVFGPVFVVGIKEPAELDLTLKVSDPTV
jgi:hypothetical protein